MPTTKERNGSKKAQGKSKLTQDQKDLLAFLVDAKRGSYAKIDLKSLPYARQPEETSSFNGEDDYLYSVA